MELYILKSGVCLAIFYGFYKLLLEKASFHNFKRFYLLAALVVAFGIPLITFTEYVEPVPMAPVQEFNFQPLETTVIEETPKTNYLPIILWSVYGAGVLFFGFMFFKNLWGLVGKIKRNPKLKSKSFINVLLNDLVIPHTFFSYIFLNKHKFETQQIPKEVLLHEETHAKQKHSLDILLIELLQVIFWFNPFIYLIKHSIKLNHEFLADHAVLKQGTETLKYQSLLLAFSSNASEPQLANAINYSSIKKRFTVMNTHTTKKALWLRSLILLPLLAVLIYSFSEKKVVEKPQIYQIANDEIKVHISKDKKVTIGNETFDFNSLSEKLIELTENLITKPVLYLEIDGKLDDKYLNKIKNELKKSNLDVSTIKASSIYLEENDADYLKLNKYLNSLKYAADTIYIKSKDGELIKGTSSPGDMYLTVPQLESNSKKNEPEEPKTNQSVISIDKKGEVAAIQQKAASNEIKIHINKDKKVTIGNETIGFNSLSDKLIEMTRDKVVKPSVNIEIDGHITSEYLETLKTELQKSNLNISTIRATSIFFDENKESYKKFHDHFKGIKYTADSITYINPQGEVIKGFSGPKIIGDTRIPKTESNEGYDIITLKVPRNKNHSMSSNDLKSLSDYANEIYSTENKTNKE